MAKCTWGPMQIFIEGVAYGVVSGFNLIEGGLITTTAATLSGQKTRTGEYQLWELSGGTLDGCSELPSERCGLTVVLVLLGNRNIDDPDVLKSVTLIDADINGRPNRNAGGDGSIADVTIVACDARYNYGRAA